jgi:hypothetical protein
MKDNDSTQLSTFPYIFHGKYIGIKPITYTHGKPTEVRNTGGDIGRTSMKDYKEKAGKSTGGYSIVGKPILEDEANVRKSEWTKTFIVDGKYYTAPSIINGIEYTEDQLKTLYEEGAISADGPYDTIGKAIKSAKDHTEALGKTVLTSPYQQR